MTHIIRVSGFVLLGAGALLYVANLSQIYIRGGIPAVIERLTSIVSETWMLVLCVGPGLILLALAEKRK